MKAFDGASIASRTSARLQSDPNWGPILVDSAIDTFNTETAETLAEAVRYQEYMLNEATWGNARNLTSVFNSSQYLGYSPQSQQSALGVIYVSHDPKLATAGTPTNNIYGVGDLAGTLSVYSGSNFTIPKYTVFTASGIPFISVEDVIYTTGLQYTTISVIQGTLQTFSQYIDNTINTTNLTLQIQGNNIEARANTLSASLFIVSITLPTTTVVTCTEYASILLANFSIWAYQLIPTIASQTASTITYGLNILFGDGIVAQQVPVYSTINIQYLSTLGIAGNINNSYTFTYTGTALPIYVTNFNPIIGGANGDSVTDIISKAPQAYLNTQAIVTLKQYQKVIGSIPNVLVSTVYGQDTFVSGIPYRYLKYSAIGQDGNTLNVDSLLPELLYGFTSPLDNIQNIAPSFIDIELNVKFAQKNASSDPVALTQQIEQTIYQQFGYPYYGFMQSMDIGSIQTLVGSTYSSSIKNLSVTYNVNNYIPASTFTLSGYSYQSSFVFDPSLVSLSLNVQPILRLDVVFNATICPGCTVKNRTVLVIYNPTTATYTLQQYNWISPGSTVLSDGNYYNLPGDVIDTDFVNNLNNPSSNPPVLIPTSSPNYVNFGINLNTSSYTTTSSLGTGVISIPTTFQSAPYINFSASPSLLNQAVSIYVTAIPNNQASVTPLASNNFVRLFSTSIRTQITS